MRILFRVAIRMVHSMQNGISPGIQKGRSLGKERKTVKEFFPELIHLEHLMRTISMEEESLRK